MAASLQESIQRKPNQEEMTEVSKILFARTDELREAILKSDK